MSRWDAVSDRDYFDEINGPYGDAIERTCDTCGRPVYVSRSEPYTLVVTCEQCQRKGSSVTTARAAQRVPQGATKAS